MHLLISPEVEGFSNKFMRNRSYGFKSHSESVASDWGVVFVFNFASPRGIHLPANLAEFLTSAANCSHLIGCGGRFNEAYPCGLHTNANFDDLLTSTYVISSIV